MILCPMTKKILQAMYCSSIGLECITLWGDSNGKHCLKEQLECLGYSRQIKSIRSVSLYLRERDGDNSAGLLRQSMKLFSRQASHLVALEFKRDIYSMNPPFNGLLLVDDITNFASLESLHIEGCRFGPENDDFVDYILSSEVEETKLKKLDLEVTGMAELFGNYDHPQPTFQNVNEFIAKLIEMSLLLEGFKITGEARCNNGCDEGVLNFSFKNHKRLSAIEMRILGLTHYTFTGNDRSKDGFYWSEYSTKMTPVQIKEIDAINFDRGFHIHLKWQGHVFLALTRGKGIYGEW